MFENEVSDVEMSDYEMSHQITLAISNVIFVWSFCIGRKIPRKDTDFPYLSIEVTSIKNWENEASMQPQVRENLLNEFVIRHQIV